MTIRIESLLTGATAASGVVGVIDVFRAFTTAAVALANGASRIVMVAGADEALALRDAGIGQIVMGEVHGEAPPGFDYGNSPFAVSAVDFKGATIIQRTSAGTQGIAAAAPRAERLYAAALVTASATARAMAAGDPARITLVAMGKEAVDRTDEDELCALHLRDRLQGRSGDAEAVRRVILAGAEAIQFRQPKPPHRFPQDLEIALAIDRHDFAIRVVIEHGRPVARMERAD